MSGLPEGWAEARVAGARILARRESLDVVRSVVERAGTLHAAARRHPAVMGGRSEPRVLSLHGVECVVRAYHRGGGMRWLHDRYLRTADPRPLLEIRVSEVARERGIDTPHVVAAVIYPAGLFHRAEIATRRIDNAEDLARLTFGDTPWPEPAQIAAWGEAGGLVRQVLERGVVHADLHPGNILIERTTEGMRAWLLDLDRARVTDEVPANDRARVLARFRRSVRKHERKGRSLSPPAREAFETALRG